MNKTWLVAKHEYTRHVFRWRFLLVLISMPLFVLLMVALVLISVSLQFDRSPVGYVDQANIIKVDTLANEFAGSLVDVQFLPYPDEASARAALEKKAIQAFFVIPTDYRQSSSARMVYIQKPVESINSQFRQILRINLLEDQPETITHRVINGSNISVIATSEEKQSQETNNNLFRSALPIALTYLIVGSLFTCSGYLIKAVADDIENRTIEILATSGSPQGIMAGKILGLASVGITQMLVWLSLPLLIAVFVVMNYPPFQNLVNWTTTALILVTAFPTFLLFCTIIATVGIIIRDGREGQSLTAMVTLLNLLPFGLLMPISINPSSTLAVFFSLFPLTASNTLLFRAAFAEIPTWQIIASLAIQVLTTAGALWLSGWVFRRWILGFQFRFRWRDLLQNFVPALIRSRRGTA